MKVILWGIGVWLCIVSNYAISNAKKVLVPKSITSVNGSIFSFSVDKTKKAYYLNSPTTFKTIDGYQVGYIPDTVTKIRLSVVTGPGDGLHRCPDAPLGTLGDGRCSATDSQGYWYHYGAYVDVKDLKDGAPMELPTPTVSKQEGELWCAVFETDGGVVLRGDYNDSSSPSGLSGYCHSGKIIPPTPPSPTCSVTSANPMNVDLGQIERSDIQTSGGAQKIVPLTVTCDSTDPMPLSVKTIINMPTSWSDTQLLTSNKDLGVTVTADGVPLKNGTTFQMNVTGSATSNLGFTLNRNPATSAESIATGGYTASMALVINLP
ncbi:fimbrial protein [Edwardsiella anguillarum]|uniref:fimbrial protein n=1 Tax=Edwardsiella anguillarum TaxID=1821960 RepID=UPI0024B80E73|nr:fimbrial protein [Edwardsiella anguillarum]WHQ15239.1 fimbrial protein [Edwardsiella anguillarum]